MQHLAKTSHQSTLMVYSHGWLRDLGSSIGLFPNSLYFRMVFCGGVMVLFLFFCLNLHHFPFSLVFLCRAIFPPVLSILFLLVASNIKLHYLLYLPSDSSRFPCPLESLSNYKQPLHAFINPISSAFCNCHLIKTGVPRGFQWPLTQQP